MSTAFTTLHCHTNQITAQHKDHMSMFVGCSELLEEHQGTLDHMLQIRFQTHFDTVTVSRKYYM